MIQFNKSTIEELKDLMLQYEKTLSSPFDSFLEAHILDSVFYNITLGEELIGYFAVHQNKLITQYFLKKEYRKLSQEIYQKIKKIGEVQSAFVYTGDEFFLSHALDEYRQLNHQAYFFQDSGRPVTRAKELTLIQAQLDDAAMIKNLSADFFSDVSKDIRDGKIFIAKDKVNIIGFGVMEPGVLLKNSVSIGMYVIEEARLNGYGQSILICLKEMVYTQGKFPIAGCWYYNHLSKKTLESAGMETHSRLFRIYY